MLLQAVQDAVHRHTREAEIQQVKHALGKREAGNPAVGRSAAFLHVAGLLLVGTAVLIGGLVVLALLVGADRNMRSARLLAFAPPDQL